MKLYKKIASLSALLAFGWSAFAMTNDDVIKMAGVGLSPEIMVGAVKGAPKKNFDLSVDGLIALKNAKIPDAVIAAMMAPPETTSSPAKPETLSQGCYFTHGGVVTRADALPDPERRVSGKAYIPFANLGSINLYIWFPGVAAAHVAERGDQIIFAGYDVRPELATLNVKEGKRYATLTRHGKLVEGSVVTNCVFNRDNNHNWVATLPKDLRAGEYFALVDIQGRETPCFDLGVK